MAVLLSLRDFQDSVAWPDVTAALQKNGWPIRGVFSDYTSCMQIFLNGKAHECATGATVATVLAETGYGERRVAVEVNREIVPRSRHADHVLHEGDRVEIVHAIGGG